MSRGQRVLAFACVVLGATLGEVLGSGPMGTLQRDWERFVLGLSFP